jgi:hypothetical protein
MKFFSTFKGKEINRFYLLDEKTNRFSSRIEKNQTSEKGKRLES